MDIDSLLPRSDDAKFLHVRYQERWEHLKPVIVELYMGRYGPKGKPMSLSQVLVFMRDHYSFHAAESQYRHWLNNKWGLRRRTLAGEKEAIIATLGKRALPGTSTSNVTLNGNKAVDKKQLTRYLRAQTRRRQAEPIQPGVLTSWTLPYAAYSMALGLSPGQPSPSGGTGATPSYVTVASPEATTPGHPAAAPSPAMQLVHRKTAQDRASLLLQGRHLELLASCGTEDRTTLIDYLHDFYIHSFVVAKHWGRGPRPGEWTAGRVSTLTLESFDISSQANLMNTAPPTTGRGRLDTPAELCPWSTHVHGISSQAIPEPAVDAQDGFDINGPRSWARWPPDVRKDCSFTRSLQESVANGTFSRTPADDLPIAHELLSRSVQQDPEALRMDAWKLAIMAGNVGLLHSLVDECHGNPPKGIDEIHPFHLAATFLNGDKTSRGMSLALRFAFGGNYLVRHERDESGHTVLDAFMVAILRSHTSVSPEQVSMGFNPPDRFPGEEQDICGRWNPVSPRVRALFRDGYARVPADWKHMLCYAATQAVCNGLSDMLGPTRSPSVNVLSGLFVRRCHHCGLELKLGPLHTLVVVAFYLADRGMPGETLFGAFAILLTLFKLWADASWTTVTSVSDILGHAEAGRCHHKHMDASDLMEAVPPDLVAHWSMDCQAGWACIRRVLLLAKRYGDGGSQANGDSARDESARDHPCPDCDLGGILGAQMGWLDLPCGDHKHGLLWAMIRFEYLLYPSSDAGKPRLSRLYSMDTLKVWLEGNRRRNSSVL